MIDTYVLGTEPVPDWISNRLMPYKKPDGATGYEFHGYLRDYELEPGDVLEKKDRKIYVLRRKHIEKKVKT